MASRSWRVLPEAQQESANMRIPQCCGITSDKARIRTPLPGRRKCHGPAPGARARTRFNLTRGLSVTLHVSLPSTLARGQQQRQQHMCSKRSSNGNSNNGNNGDSNNDRLRRLLLLLLLPPPGRLGGRGTGSGQAREFGQARNRLGTGWGGSERAEGEDGRHGRDSDRGLGALHAGKRTNNKHAVLVVV